MTRRNGLSARHGFPRTRLQFRTRVDPRLELLEDGDVCVGWEGVETYGDQGCQYDRQGKRIMEMVRSKEDFAGPVSLVSRFPRPLILCGGVK